MSGGYWSSTPDGVLGRSNVFWVLPTGASGFDQQSAANAYSVRCVRAREGQAIPCFFPLAGWGGTEVAIGKYWTCTGWSSSSAYCLRVLSASAAPPTSDEPLINGTSVRCVRAREGQAIPLFWIVWFWVL